MCSEMEVEDVQASSSDGASNELQMPADLVPDQVAWAQCLLEASYFDSCFSPKTYFSPKGDSPKPAFPEFCPSPLFSDQLKMLNSWSSRVTKQVEESAVSVSSESEPCTSCEPDKAQLSNSRTGCVESGDGEQAVKDSRKRKASPSSDDDGSLNEKKNSSVKKMKVKGTKRLREPRYAIKTRSEVDIMEDGYKWRKYGQKPVKSSPHPRNYYRCTTANCPVRKRVERDTEDTSLVITSYEGTHTHPKVIQQKNSAAGQLSDFQHVNDVGPNFDPLFPPIPNLGHLWGSPLNNFPAWSQQQAPSVHDNLGLIMAYQLVKLQWELQARTQQFVDFNNQTASTSFSNPETVNSFGQLGSQLPNPQLSMGSSLLRKRASAFRNGGPIPLDLQSIAKMRQLRPAQHTAGQPPQHDHNSHGSRDLDLIQAPA